jgi:tetratricopeptide (TPR) repeat protein
MTRHEEEGRLDAAMQKADDLLVNSLKRDETMRKYRVIIGALAVLVVGLLTTVIVMTATRSSSTRQVALDKADPEVLMQDGWQLWGQFKWREAELKFDQATKADPKLTNAWNGLGWARLNGGKPEPAMVAFTKCIELEPNHPAALNGMGQAYYAKNQFDKAEPFLVKAANNKATAAWWGLAKMYLLQGKFEEAQKWAQKLIDAGDKSAQPLLDAAKAKQIPDGLRDQITPMAAGSARARKSNAHVLAESWGIKQINLAYQLRTRGDLAAAEAILKEVAAKPVAEGKPDLQTWVPQLFVAPLALAELWQSQGKLAEAETMNKKVADKVVELRQKHPNEEIWLPSYAAHAYTQRIRAALEAKPAKVDVARALAEEFKTRVPGYTGIMDYTQMTGEIAASQSTASK